MKLLNVSVVPAQPGHELIYREDGGFHEVWGQVIAWRVSTWHRDDDPESLSSEMEPLDAMGEPGSTCVGVKNPDGSVVLFHDRQFKTWEDFCDYAAQKRSQST